MADSFAQLVVQLELQQAAFAQGMNDAAKKLDSVGQSAKKSQKDLEDMAGSMSKVGSAIGSTIAALLTFDMAKRIAEAADSVNLLKGSLTALLGDGNRAADMMQRIFDIADRTGA